MLLWILGLKVSVTITWSVRLINRADLLSDIQTGFIYSNNIEMLLHTRLAIFHWSCRWSQPGSDWVSLVWVLPAWRYCHCTCPSWEGDQCSSVVSSLPMLLHGSYLLLDLSHGLKWVLLDLWKAMIHSLPLSSAKQIYQLFIGHDQQLVWVQSPVGELVECLLLLLFHFSHLHGCLEKESLAASFK